MTRSRLPSSIAAAVVLALALTSCASDQSGASDSDGGIAVQPAPGEPLPGQPLTEGGSSGSDGGAAVDDVERSVIVTASLSLSDARPIEVADEVQELAEATGGRVDRRNDTPAAGADAASAELVLRIPSEDLDDVVSDISGLATVVWSSLDRQDVTGTVTDLTARIGALDASIDRLLSLLGDAESTSDLITIESELTTRQAERDSLAAQQESLADQVEYSTVTVQIGVPGEVGQAGPGDFWGGLALGLASIGAFFTGLMVVVGVLLPWLVLLAIILAVLWGIRRRRAGTARDAAPAAPRTDHEATPPLAASPVAPTTASPVTSGTGLSIPPRPPLPTAAPGTVGPTAVLEKTAAAETAPAEIGLADAAPSEHPPATTPPRKTQPRKTQPRKTQPATTSQTKTPPATTSQTKTPPTTTPAAKKRPAPRTPTAAPPPPKDDE